MYNRLKKKKKTVENRGKAFYIYNEVVRTISVLTFDLTISLSTKNELLE